MKIAIIDYGLGNIFSIRRAISYVGFESIITDDHEVIASSDRLILPGVGAFGDGMIELKRKGLDKVILKYASQGKPILGVCLGMQLLMSESEEFGRNEGLNIIPGRVMRFPDPEPRGLSYKIPHVGWNQIFPYNNDQSLWRDSILAGNQPGDFVYFVHSFRVVPDRQEYVLARTVYGGTEFCSVIRKGNVTGCQFHPELSAHIGLNIYREFLNSKGSQVDACITARQ